MSKCVHPGVSAFVREIFKEYRHNAKRRGLSFVLSIDLFEKLLTSPCNYCGDPPRKKSRVSAGVMKVNGIDRLNHKVGYLPDNVVTCCAVCNFMKGRLDKSAFFRQIKLIYARLRRRMPQSRME